MTMGLLPTSYRDRYLTTDDVVLAFVDSGAGEAPNPRKPILHPDICILTNVGGGDVSLWIDYHDDNFLVLNLKAGMSYTNRNIRSVSQLGDTNTFPPAAPVNIPLPSDKALVIATYLSLIHI